MWPILKNLDDEKVLSFSESDLCGRFVVVTESAIRVSGAIPD
jgi:hypothetical protein